MKKVLLIIFSVTILSAETMAALQWGSAPNVINDFSGSPIAVSDSFDPTVGAFAQLIRILNGTSAYEFTTGGSGIDAVNEQIVDVVYAGQNDELSDPGTIAFGPNILNGSEFDGYYYVRVFDTAQATLSDWNLGNSAPVPAGANYYYQSDVLNYTHVGTSPPIIWDFTGGSTVQTTLAIVPEPGTMALLGVGLIGLAARRRMNG